MKLNRIAVTALVTLALAFGFVAQAQPTEYEKNLSIIFATDIEGTIVSCPAGWPITDLAACFRVWGSHDLVSMQLNNAMASYSDANWTHPWNGQDGVMIRAFYVKGYTDTLVFLTQDGSDSSRTIVWFIEQDRFPE